MISPRPAALLLAGFGLALALAVRLLLLPTPGLPDDLDEFARWVRDISTGVSGEAYARQLSFPPVMTYIWGLVGLLEPAFRTATDSSSSAVRTALKMPAVLADLGLAIAVGFHLRARPRWAIGAALAILLNPAVIDVSAWWGQYESVYVLGALAAFLLAAAGRRDIAAMALAVMLMTKPQAVPLLIPFAAWFLARYGLRGCVRPALIGAATIVLLWLPFIPAGGPAAYLAGVAAYQDGPFGVLSLRAWNPWWILQVVAANGDFALDRAAIAGPVTFRGASLVVAGLLELAVFAAVYRLPSPAALAWGVAASAMVAFAALTTMHERYAYPALIFLALAFPDRRAVILWLVLSVVFTLNLWAAAPPTRELAALLPVDGALSVVGSLAMTAITAACLLALMRLHRPRAATEAAPA